MTIFSVTTDFAGQIGVVPRVPRVDCNDTYAVVTTAGYLNSSWGIQPTDLIAVTYGATSPQTTALFTPSFSSTNVITLVPLSNNSEVNYIGTPINGNLPQNSGTSGNITDSGIVASTVLTGSSSANDYLQMISINEVILETVGTWTKTRVARSNYSLVHTATAETAILGIDITPAIRLATSKGFELNSIDIIYTIATANLTAHSVTLDAVSYANNAAVTITNVPLTGTLSTATQTNPYVSNVAVTTPAFLNIADAKYVMEVTVNAASTSAYSFLGLNLNYTKTAL